MSTAKPNAPASSAAGVRSDARRMHAIVAVKALSTAKSRLAADLDSHAREDLVLAMLHDTLRVVASVPTIEAVTVVTPDPTVAALAYSARVDVFADPGYVADRPADPSAPERSLNDALRAAADHIRSAHGNVDLVVLQADLPALRTSELVEAATAARAGGRSIVVDHHGTGTSALFSCDPDQPLDPHFGPESARRHQISGARVIDGSWPGLQTDVDTHADLLTVRTLGVGPATHASLIRFNSVSSNTR
ncbi:2-phospho-L-lactate guanylyltransferase [Rhodococcus sp. 27YEA15]|uniref:2-phospho-L-lactate guanylyltransferase n=1 Tax=Rhodococcus sp. 27YEA15 TaxID=3156259 RepID=UPI003C7CF161